MMGTYQCLGTAWIAGAAFGTAFEEFIMAIEWGFHGHFIVCLIVLVAFQDLGVQVIVSGNYHSY